MNHQDYTSANKAAWDQVGPHHRAQNFASLTNTVKQAAPDCLDPGTKELLNRFEVRSKSIAHLCSNNGRELVAIKKLGAQRCVGFDISAEFTKQAQELSTIAQTECEFITSNVFDIPASFDGQFDLVLVTIGALGWMPDLAGFSRWLRVCLNRVALSRCMNNIPSWICSTSKTATTYLHFATAISARSPTKRKPASITTATAPSRRRSNIGSTTPWRPFSIAARRRAWSSRLSRSGRTTPAKYCDTSSSKRVACH